MDFLNFIESNAIRAYLKDKKYVCSPLLAAWLIYSNSSITLYQRHLAWNAVINDLADCEVPERMNCAYYPSLHSLLVNCINRDKEILNTFEKEEKGSVYYYKIRYIGENENYFYDVDFFHALAECLEAAKTELDADVESVTVIKKEIEKTNYRIEAVYDNELNIKRIQEYGEDIDHYSCDYFDGMWFDIPNPFKEGDIVIDSTGFIWVLSEPISWERFNNKQKGYTWDTTDMSFRGYGIDETGSVFLENGHDYHKLEYYHGLLKGEKRFLLSISNQLKGNLNLEIFLEAYKRIVIEKSYTIEKLEEWWGEDLMSKTGLSSTEITV